MGILVYNRYGIWMFLVGMSVFTVTILATAPFGWGWLAIYGTGCAWILMDLRVRRRNGKRWFYDLAGGHLYFIPIWLIGLALIAGGVAMQRVVAEDNAEKAAADQQLEQRLQDLRHHLSTRAAEDSNPSTQPTTNAEPTTEQ